MFAYLYNFQINRHQQQLKHLQFDNWVSMPMNLLPYKWEWFNTTITSLTKKSRLCQKMKWLIKTRVLSCCCSLAQSYCKTKQFWKKCEIWSLLMAIGMQKCKTFYQLGFFSIGSFKENVVVATKRHKYKPFEEEEKYNLCVWALIFLS